MTFALTAESLADALEPHMEERPQTVATPNGVVVADPLSLRVVVQPAPLPGHFDVRCFQQLGDVPIGVVFMAANSVNFGSDSGARARVLQDEDGLTVLIENGVCGPITPGQDFAMAIQSVLGGVHAFGQAAAHYRAMVAAIAGAAAEDAPAEPAPSTPPPASAEPAPGPAAALTPGYI